MREGATTLTYKCVYKAASVAIRGERGSYNADSKVIGGHADLTLCAEAGTVFHETQCTPRQLVERVKELEDTLCSLAGRFLRCAAAGISAAEAYDSFYRDDVTEVLSKALPNAAAKEAGK